MMMMMTTTTTMTLRRRTKFFKRVSRWTKSACSGKTALMGSRVSSFSQSDWKKVWNPDQDAEKVDVFHEKHLSEGLF